MLEIRSLFESKHLAKTYPLSQLTARFGITGLLRVDGRLPPTYSTKKMRYLIFYHY